MSVAESPDERAPSATPARRGTFRSVRAAFVTLTRVPVGGFPYDDDEWRWSSAHLPLVGACVGGLSALVWLATVRAGYGVAAGVTTVASLLLTGAMHEDGLADTADGLGGGRGDRERILRIMKDSSVGAYGAAALALSLTLRVALLVRLGALAPLAIVTAECASRFVPVWLMTRLPYVSDPAAQKSAVVARAGAQQLVVALIWTLAIAAPCAWRVAPVPATAAVVGAPIVAVSLGAAWLFRKRIGGITGDTLGAAQQVAWLALLLAFTLAKGGPP